MPGIAFAANNTLNGSTAVFRDPSAWMHVVVNTNGTFVNGVSVAAGNAISAGTIGTSCDFYLADFHFVDGQALAPTSFGQSNANGVWIPKAYTGAYGTNGFHLTFDPAHFTTAGGVTTLADQSGNGNDFTATGFELADNTKVTYDHMEDSPTKNALTFNPLNANATPGNAHTASLLYGLNYAKPINNGSYTGNNFPVNATFTQEPLEGKYFYQFTGQRGQRSGSTYQGQGIGFFDKDNPTSAAGIAFDYCITRSAANQHKTWRKTTQGTFGSADGRWPALNGVDAADGSENLFYGFFYDTASGDLWFLTNNTNEEWGVGNWQPLLLKPDFTFETYTGTLPDAAKWNVPNANFAGVLFSSQGNPGGRGLQTVNAWEMMGETLPVGWKYARSTADNPAAPIPNGRDHFRAITDTGANILTAAQTAFPNGLWWIKDRVNANNHQLVDSVRGGNNAILSNSDFEEIPYTAPAGNSVAWCWATPGTPAANNDGSIQTQLDVNNTAGFSIATYDGVGGFGSTIGVGFQPEFVMIKERLAKNSWVVLHKDLSSVAEWQGANTVTLNSYSSALFLNSPEAARAYTINSQINGAGYKFVAYSWHSVPGYSAIGSYTGNSNMDGPFINTGFRSAFVLIKNTLVGNWFIYDTIRNVANPADQVIFPDLTQQEVPQVAANVDILSNGFKIRGTGDGVNFSNAKYIYAAFAENPFGGSNVSPANAR
jgi:hypothetical protein